jgi:drug/metabolite transporter (DMT)-like permease
MTVKASQAANRLPQEDKKTGRTDSMSSRFCAVSPEWVLVLVSALWGASFIVLSIALESISPALLVTIRFGFGALLLALLLRGQLFRLNRTDWVAGIATGVCIFLGYFLQTVGLQWIPSSVSAFLTALYVPFVPLLQWIIYRRFPGWIATTGISAAFIGMMLIINPATMTLTGNLGEWFTIASALACAGEILVIAHFTTHCDPKAFCFTQLLTVSVLAFFYCIAFEPIRFTPTPELFICLAILVGMIAFNQYAITWAQKTVPALRAVLIYTLEPVFAGIIGWLFGEKLGVGALFGGLLVIASVLLSSWLPKFLAEKKRLQEASHD